MKILQLTNRIPYPLHDGGNLAAFAYTEGLVDAGVELSLLSMNTKRHFVDTASLPDFFHNKLKRFDAVYVDNSIKPLDAFLNLFTATSYNIQRFITKDFEEKLIEVLQNTNFDIVHLEGLYLVPYIPTIRKYSNAKIALRSHNIEYFIWERLAQGENNFIKKKYLSLLAKRLKKFELNHLQDTDLIIPISEKDEEIYKSLGCKVDKLFYQPFAINLKKIESAPIEKQEGIKLYNISALDWLPNREGMNWLLENVLPSLNQQLPNIKFYLAGRNMPQHYFDIKLPNVEVLGEVPDAKVFESDKDILLAPLFSGSGVRIKIFQAMAAGKAIITTSIGAEGIDAQDGEHLIIANTAKDFIQKTIELANNPQRIAILGSNAQNLIKEKYNRQEIIQSLLEKYQSLSAS